MSRTRSRTRPLGERRPGPATAPGRGLRARVARVRGGGDSASGDRVRGDRGASVVELAVLAPGLMMLCMLILQFGLWFNAREAALASAQAGATVAREEAATNAAWAANAQAAATQYFDGLQTHLLGRLTARASGDPHASVSVTVSGPLGFSVFSFFNLKLHISATAGGPVECFRPAGQNGC